MFVAKIVKYMSLEIVRKEAMKSTSVEGMNTKHFDCVPKLLCHLG